MAAVPAASAAAAPGTTPASLAAPASSSEAGANHQLAVLREEVLAVYEYMPATLLGYLAGNAPDKLGLAWSVSNPDGVEQIIYLVDDAARAASGPVSTSIVSG